MGRAPCCEKVGLKKGRWTEEEDEILTKYIQANGEGSWRSLPKNAGLLRCGKSCRLRWINYLRADLKRGNISVEEEGLIIKLHASFGNRWSLIASHLAGRTDNEIKNYWNSHLSRKVYTPRAPSSTTRDEPRVLDTPPKRKGGRTSRWAMKKNKTYAHKPAVAATDTAKQAVSVAAHRSSETSMSSVPVPLPPTPALESETLTATVDEDFMVLEEPDTEERKEDEEEEEEGQDSGALRCVPVEEGKGEGEGGINEGCVVCVDGGDGDGAEEMFGLCDHDDDHEGRVVIDDDDCGALSFNDIMDTTCMLEHQSGVFPFWDERDPTANSSNDGASATCTHKVDQGESWNGGFDGWDWESVMQLNDQSAPTWGQSRDSLPTWLWEDDDWEKDFLHTFGEIDPAKQNDMVAWFLS